MWQKTLAAFILLLTFSATTSAKGPHVPPEIRQTAYFLAAKDGDSLLVSINGKKTQIRLIGIDCPEKGQEWGTKATLFTKHFCENSPLILEFDKKQHDRFGRKLAYVFTPQGMLNKALVQNGLALAIKARGGAKYRTLLKQTERNARAAKSGFWSKGGLALKPWQWRKQHQRRHRHKQPSPLKNSVLDYSTISGQITTSGNPVWPGTSRNN